MNPSKHRMSLSCFCLSFLLSSTPTTASAAAEQPMVERTVNLEGTWITAPHTLHFQLSHRFQMAGSDVDVSNIFTEDGKVVNYPTFGLSYGVASWGHLGVQYSSNSIFVGQSNEWQPFARVTPIRGGAGGRVSAGVAGAWNAATDSFDGEVAVQADLGSLTLIGAGRAFSNPFDRAPELQEAELALAGGAVLHLNRFVSLTADYTNMITQDDAQIAWSAGAAIQIPATPHTLAFFATNVTSGTLQGRSVGVDGAAYWGFEFTIPFNAGRWGQLVSPPSPRPVAAPVAGAANPVDPTAPVVEVAMAQMQFHTKELEIAPGTTVRWVNKDPLEHTTTSVDGLWDSGLIGAEGVFEWTFEEEGRFEYICTPHNPFMTGVIVVKAK